MDWVLKKSKIIVVKENFLDVRREILHFFLRVKLDPRKTRAKSIRCIRIGYKKLMSVEIFVENRKKIHSLLLSDDWLKAWFRRDDIFAYEYFSIRIYAKLFL